MGEEGDRRNVAKRNAAIEAALIDLVDCDVPETIIVDQVWRCGAPCKHARTARACLVPGGRRSRRWMRVSVGLACLLV